MIVLGTDADRRGERGFHVAGSSFFGMLGFILLAACHDKGPVALYIFTCMSVAGAYSQFSVFITCKYTFFIKKTLAHGSMHDL